MKIRTNVKAGTGAVQGWAVNRSETVAQPPQTIRVKTGVRAGTPPQALSVNRCETFAGRRGQ